MLRKHSKVIYASRKFVDISDLENCWMLRLQRRFDPFWNFSFCFVIPSLVPVFIWDEYLLNSFLVAGMAKYVILLHCTWSVNSVVHKFGHRPYQRAPLGTPGRHTEQISRFHRDDITTESPIVSLLAFGEGWHSWHHAYPFDYATSELEPGQQYNPTKVFIDFMAFLGLVSGRKRALRMWNKDKQLWLEKAYKETGKKWKFIETLQGWPLFRIRKLIPQEDS